MKTYLGNYLGIVISGGQKDPEKRGRCQIFIPHIMPTLYEGWNETGFKETGGSRNIKIIGDNLQDSLTSAEIEKLRKILPWSECAAPAVGAGPSVWMANDNTMSSSLRNNGYKDGKKVSLGSFEYSGGNYTDFGTLAQISDKLSDKFSGAVIPTPDSTPERPKRQTYCARESWRLGINAFGPIGNPKTGDTQTVNSDLAGTLENAKDIVPIFKEARVPGTAKPAYTQLDIKSFKNVPEGAVVITKGGSQGLGHVAWKVDKKNWSWGNGLTPSFGTPYTDDDILGVFVPSEDYIRQNYANAEYKTQNFFSPGGETVVVDNPSGITQTPDGNPRVATGMNDQDSPIPFDLGEVKAKLSNDGTLTDEQAKVATAVYAAAYQNARNDSRDVESSHIIASAIVGNVKQETSFDPNELHDAPKDRPTEFQGYGLLGWQSRTNDKRLNNLVYFAQQRREVPGINYTNNAIIKPQDIERAGGISVNTQIDFLFAEFKSRPDVSFPYPYSSRSTGRPSGGDKPPFVLEEFYKQSTPAEAALYLSDRAVRPGDPKNDVRQKVAENAFEIYSEVDPNLFAQIYSTPYSPYQHFVDIPSNPGGNSNNMPTGMFGYAMEGQAVWCFFREGDALFPVYFAASYGQEDWSRIYQNGGSGKDQAHSSWSLNMPGGGIEATSITDQDNTVFGPDNILEFRHNFGSVLRFTNSTSLLYSQYSHKQHVQQDYADIVMANREMRTFGDSNINVGQNQYIAVGKWDATAEEAANELQKIINEGMEIKSKEIQEQFKNGESGTVT